MSKLPRWFARCAHCQNYFLTEKREQARKWKRMHERQHGKVVVLMQAMFYKAKS